MKMDKLFLYFIVSINGSLCILSCTEKSFGPQRSVCVCNSSECDFSPAITESLPDAFQIYTTNMEGKRLEMRRGIFTFSNPFPFSAQLTLDISKKHQKIFGFGGHFTDAFGDTYNQLPLGTQDNLMRSLFSSEGNEYNLCKVPIGSSDFSFRPYSLDDISENLSDDTLEHFNLTAEDYEYKIPLIQKARDLSEDTLSLIASVWSPPLWMKTVKTWAGSTYLAENYYQLYADYYVKFLEAYDEEGINYFWGITTGNKPELGNHLDNKVNVVGWDPVKQAKWIGENLGPTLRTSKYENIKILAHDDEITYLPWLYFYVSSNKRALSYIDGSLVHWNKRPAIPNVFLYFAFNSNKRLFLFNTESCNAGTKTEQMSPLRNNLKNLGSWETAENYAYEIIENFEYSSTGWLECSLAMDIKSNSEKLLDASIVVNTDTGEFYKQPKFYVFAHFSKFVSKGSERLQINANYLARRFGLKYLAFRRPDGGYVVIILNRSNSLRSIELNFPLRRTVALTLEKRSITNIVFW